MTKDSGRPVVVGVDGGPGSEGALRYAVREAQRTGTTLRAVHVIPSYVPVSPMMPALADEIARAGEEILDHARLRLAELAPSLDVETRSLTGPRISGLVDAARNARVLVIGRETRNALERLMGAGTTAAVAAHATVPVVVVPQEWTPPDDRDARPVVVGLKSQAQADELLRAGFEAASARRAPLLVVHTWKLPDEYLDRIEVRSHLDEWLARGEEMAEKVLQPWRHEYPDVPVTVRVVHDEPAHALLEAAEDAALLVVLRRASVPVLGRHLGGTARAVIRRAPCPVQVVPGVEGLAETPGLEVEEAGELVR